jgi:hypothetical protein
MWYSQNFKKSSKHHHMTARVPEDVWSLRTERQASIAHANQSAFQRQQAPMK